MAHAEKFWGDMTAAERLASSVGYIEYNYGARHPLTHAAVAGDLAAFRAAGSRISGMVDERVCAIIDRASSEVPA